MIAGLTRRISSIPRVRIPHAALTVKALSEARGDIAHDSYKRKVAIVVSFVGSKYNGMQLQPGKENVIAVEGELRRALFEIGAILPSNDISRINWSRSSRTDKGVHAARLVVSAKLEILPSWLPSFDVSPEQLAKKHKEYLERSGDVRIKGLVDALNSKLPDDIRAMSCIKTNKSFEARFACSWREYEYVLPIEILQHPNAFTPPSASTLPPDERYRNLDATTLSREEILERLNAAMRQFLGTHNHHNFNKIRSKDISEVVNGIWKRKCEERRITRSKQFNRTPVTSESARSHIDHGDHGDHVDYVDYVDHGEYGGKDGSHGRDGHKSDLCGTVVAEDDSESDMDDDEASDNEDPESHHRRKEFGPWVNFEYKSDDWVTEEKPIVDKHRIRIYQAKAELKKIDNGKEMVCITVLGSGFLLNQIRLMVGAAVATARGLLPPDTISAALQLPYKFLFPLVPAEGLFLKYAGFATLNNRNYAMSSRGAENPATDALLMDDEEFAVSEEFNRKFIQPKILEDWYVNDSLLLTDFLRNLEQYRPPRVVADTWMELLAQTREVAEQERENLHELGVRRVEKNIEIFNEKAVAFLRHERAKKNKLLSKEMRPRGRGQVNNPAPAPLAMKHNLFLPSRFATELVVTTGELPGPRVERALSAIALKVALGDIPHYLTCEELLKWILQDGRSVSYWAQQPTYHELIK